MARVGVGRPATASGLRVADGAGQQQLAIAGPPGPFRTISGMICEPRWRVIVPRYKNEFVPLCHTESWATARSPLRSDSCGRAQRPLNDDATSGVTVTMAESERSARLLASLARTLNGSLDQPGQIRLLQRCRSARPRARRR